MTASDDAGSAWDDLMVRIKATTGGDLASFTKTAEELRQAANSISKEVIAALDEVNNDLDAIIRDTAKVKGEAEKLKRALDEAMNLDSAREIMVSEIDLMIAALHKIPVAAVGDFLTVKDLAGDLGKDFGALRKNIEGLGNTPAAWAALRATLDGLANKELAAAKNGRG